VPCADYVPDCAADLAAVIVVHAETCPLIRGAASARHRLEMRLAGLHVDADVAVVPVNPTPGGPVHGDAG